MEGSPGGDLEESPVVSLEQREQIMHRLGLAMGITQQMYGIDSLLRPLAHNGKSLAYLMLSLVSIP